MPSAEPHTAAQAPLVLACLEVAGRVYGLDVTHMREIVRHRAVVPLPDAPPLIEGVVDLRGTVVPVVDLRRVLAGAPVEARSTARIAICESDGLLVGLAVDAAIEVLAVDPLALGDPPALATQTGYDLMRAIVRRGDEEPVLVLSLEHVIERVYRSALPRSEARA